MTPLMCLLITFMASVCCAQNREPVPRVNLTVGWTYLWADQSKGERVNLNGWFARPGVNLGSGYEAFADVTNYYGANHKGAINSHGFTFGVSKKVLATAKAKPAVFAEAGDVRSSNAGSIVNQFAFATGASVALPFNHWVSLAITPAEYVFLHPRGEVRNDFNAKVGIRFAIGH